MDAVDDTTQIPATHSIGMPDTMADAITAPRIRLILQGDIHYATAQLLPVVSSKAPKGVADSDDCRLIGLVAPVAMAYQH